MARKTKPPNRIMGRWRIVSMSEWEADYLDEEVEAFIAFDGKGGGSFQFGCVSGIIDSRMTDRGGKPAAEFSWEGGDGADGTPLTGRGWAIQSNHGLIGRFYIHSGDESGFLARSSGATKAGFGRNTRSERRDE